MRLIKKSDIMEALANLLGKTSIPNGDLSDWERFAQASLDYCWRYHTWLWTLRKAQTLADQDNAAIILMPSDIDYYGFVQVAGTTLQDILDTGNNPYLQFNTSRGRYEIVGGAANTDVVYAVEPPELTEDVEIPFPSDRTVLHNVYMLNHTTYRLRTG